MGIEFVFATLLPWLLVAVGCWLLYLLVGQNGRILFRLQAIEEQLSQLKTVPAPAPAPSPPSGIPVGTQAPDFRLPDLQGKEHSLASFQGQKLLIVFFNPRCSYCSQMVPALAQLPSPAAPDRPVPLIVTTGDADENRQWVKDYGITFPVLLQKETEVMTLYKATGTPMGYLIDEKGIIAGDLTVGADALLDLAEPAENVLAKVNGKATGESKGVAGEGRGKTNKGLAKSKINRDGLKAGTPAPPFVLPRVGGGEVSLESYRGQKVLLVFSDPQCGPCDELAPHLERIHQQIPDLQVLMVSRGEEEANSRKIAEFGWTFPVTRQKQWEISFKYGMFATPIAYLIDEQGTITKDVAMGVEPILNLVNASAQEPDKRSIPWTIDSMK